MQKNSIHTTTTRFQLFVGVAVLIIVGYKWSLGLENHLDLLLADEAEYLRNGLNLFDIIAKNWGPTYNIWYKFLSLFNSNPVALYYLNYKVGAIGIGVLFFVFLARYNVHVLVAFVIAFCYLFTDVNINAWPRISNFVVMLFLVHFILIKNISSTVIRLILFSIVTFIAAFARPELLIVAEISALVVVVFVAIERKNYKQYFPFLIALFLVIFFLFLVYGKPADVYAGINRMYIAFCQHYAIAYKVRTNATFNAVIEWRDFTKPLFGDCTTVSQIFIKHFNLCIPHFLFTTKQYFVLLQAFITGFIFPLYLIKSTKIKLLIFLFLIGTIFFVVFNKKCRASFFDKINKHKGHFRNTFLNWV